MKGGVKLTNNVLISKNEVKADIARVTRKLGHAPSRNEYRANGKYSSWTAEARFNTWTKAQKAGSR